MTDLREVTDKEIALVSEFITLLKQEFDALQTGEVSSLAEISSRKAQLIEQLNALELSRGKLLGVGAPSSIADAMKDWLLRQPADAPAAVNWKNLMNLAREAKQRSAVNGQLINALQQQNSELLDILTERAGKQTLYGSNGQASQLTGNRILDSA